MFKNMRITPKLILCFMITVALASISGLIGTVLLVQSDDNYSKALIENGFAQGEIGTFNTYLNKGAAVVRDIVLLTEQADIQASQNELNEIQAKTTEAFEKMKANCRTPDEIVYISKIEQKLPEYRNLRQKVVDLGLQNRNDEALALFRTEARPVLNEVMAAAEGLTELNVRLGNEVSASLTSQSRVAITSMVIVILAAIAISIGFAVVIAKSFAKPIINVKEAAAQLAQGDLNIQLTADTKEEIGEMTRSFAEATSMLKRYIADISKVLGEVSGGNFNVRTTEEFRGDFKQMEQALAVITKSLSNTLGQINQSADQVSSGSDQVSSGAQALSQGSTEQASSVEELAATINEISSQVKDTADSAKTAQEQTDQAGQQVMICNGQMQEMIQAMNEISNSSSEIGKIIKTIEDIAFQTNILALNAAVEAARAGEAGKGFAVVADEVRNLASKSADASKNTASLIEQSIRAVENGTRLANETAQSLLQVVDGTKEVTVTVQQIADAASSQATSIAQVTQGIDQISSVVQTNSATAEESAAASEELSGQAQMLKDLVGQFKLMDVDYSDVHLEAPKRTSDMPSRTVHMDSGKY